MLFRTYNISRKIKTKSTKNWCNTIKPPQNPKQIKQYWGLIGYYLRFPHNFSKISQNLTKLLRKETEFIWSEEQQKAFKILKEALTKEPIPQYPNFNELCYSTTDTSNYAIDAVLSQKHGDKYQTIAYASRTLNRAEPLKKNV